MRTVGLRERLLSTEMKRQMRLGFGGAVAFDYLEDAQELLVNPDGPKAWAVIEELVEALKLAVPIIEEEREITVDCNTVLYRGSPDLGKVVDPEAVEQIAIYDKALNAASAALSKAHPEGE